MKQIISTISGWCLLLLVITISRRAHAKFKAVPRTPEVQTQSSEKEIPSKSHGHINDILELNKPTMARIVRADNTLNDLFKIYNQDVQPLEDAYRFSDLNRDAISGQDIFAKPMVLFLGPWSVGKSTMINYLLGIEDSHERLHTGPEPTTSDFTVLLNGPMYRTMKGMELVTDKTKHFSPLHKFGLAFTERLQGLQLQAKLLEKIYIVDTPGIIENRKQQQRGYPFNEVCQWFIDRADLIFLVFDPTKLDVGSELDTLFNLVKGHEAKLRLILNKADTVSPQELMRVYGALFWSLAPIVNVVEPPRVDVGSFWSKGYNDHTRSDLFHSEELALLNDLNQVIKNQLENKVSFIRRHAFYVRLHSLIVDRYLGVYNQNKCYFFNIFGDNNLVLRNIIENPNSFYIFKSILSYKDISQHDLPTPIKYQNFFFLNPLLLFKPLTSLCLWVGPCPIDSLERAINDKLPQLLASLKRTPQTCNGPFCKP